MRLPLVDSNLERVVHRIVIGEELADLIEAGRIVWLARIHIRGVVRASTGNESGPVQIVRFVEMSRSGSYPRGREDISVDGLDFKGQVEFVILARVVAGNYGIGTDRGWKNVSE